MRTSRVLTPLLLTLPLAACLGSSTTPITVTVDSRCRTDKIITYSAQQDSPDTVTQIRYHNASLRAVCPDMR